MIRPWYPGCGSMQCRANPMMKCDCHGDYCSTKEEIAAEAVERAKPKPPCRVCRGTKVAIGLRTPGARTPCPECCPRDYLDELEVVRGFTASSAGVDDVEPEKGDSWLRRALIRLAERV